MPVLVLRSQLLLTAFMAGVLLAPVDAQARPTFKVGSAAVHGHTGSRVVVFNSQVADAGPSTQAAAVLLWTESRPVRRGSPKRWSWKTRITWCSAHRCDRPTTVDVRRKRRAYDRSETIFRWALRLAVDGTGALVAVGDEDERPRWVLLRRHGGVRKSGTAPTQAFRAGLAYARTASGQDWAAWSDVTQNSWVGRLTDRAKLHGTLIASNADTIRLRSSSTGFVASWITRQDLREQEAGPVIVSTSAEASGLATAANQIQIAPAGRSPDLRALASGPLLASWINISQSDTGSPTVTRRAVWLGDGMPSLDQQQATSDFGGAGLNSTTNEFPWLARQDAHGMVTLCPAGVTAPSAGAPLTPQTSGTCAQSKVRLIAYR